MRAARVTVVIAGVLLLPACGAAKEWHAEPYQSGSMTPAPPLAKPSSPVAKKPAAKGAPKKPATAAQRAAAAAVKAAVAKADAAGTVSYSMTMKTEVPGQGTVSATAKGVSAMKPPVTARMTMQLKVQGQSFAMEAIVTPDAMYMKMPVELAPEFRDKPWVKLDFDDLAAASGLDFSAMMEQSQQTSPVAYLQALVAAGDVRVVGRETIRGTATTRYSGRVTADQMAAAYTGKLREQLKGMMTSLGAQPMSIDVWLGDDGMPRRMRCSMTMNGNKTQMSMEFLQYGTKLDVRPPPASKTTDFREFTGETTVT